MNEKILKEILQELKNIHYHLEQQLDFYMFVNRVEMKKEDKEVTKEVKK